MMAMLPKPKELRRVSPDEATRHVADKAVFDSWMTECEAMQDAIVESLLSRMPSAQDG